jgi:hypothetical protein
MDDDYGSAATKNLDDAIALESASRWDGAAYLTGYSIESLFKKNLRLAQDFNHLDKHDLNLLEQTLSALGGGKVRHRYNATHIRVLKESGIFDWKTKIRYQTAGSITEETAKKWVEAAKTFYRDVTQ